MPQDLDFLLKYRSFDENVVVRVVEIILEKIAEDSNYSSALSFLFKPYMEVNQALLDPFKNYLDLLKKAYLAVLKTDWHRECNGQIFTYILDLDPNFIFEYIDWIDKQKEQSHHFHDTRDYSFLWRRENYEEMMSQIVYTGARVLHEKFFILTEGARDNALIEERQDSLLTKLIEKRHKDIEFIRFLFGAIGNFSDERRFRFIALFLKSNNNFEEFEKLPLEPATWSWQGSAVPMYQTRVSISSRSFNCSIPWIFCNTSNMWNDSSLAIAFAKKFNRAIGSQSPIAISQFQQIDFPHYEGEDVR
jgi:hypothetical protein